MLKTPQENIFAEDLLQHLPVSTFVPGVQHQVVIWNKSCERLTGLRADDMIGTNRHAGLIYLAY